MAFNVGEEVICVDNSPTEDGYPCPLRKGKTYVVLKVGDCACNCIVVEPDDTGWMGKRFRRPKVDEITTTTEGKVNV